MVTDKWHGRPSFGDRVVDEAATLGMTAAG